ncbi:flavodoxin family protein [Bacillota bacterium LX-D]|nr:flavodoxin family protein [Bacillota bacterium LX-D]
MLAKTLIIACSPRPGGNSDLMAKWAEEQVIANNLDVETIYLRKLKFSPCIECDQCYQDGKCHVKDDMQEIYPKLIEAERIIVSAPIFFYSFGALAKAFIDRAQCYWSKKFVLKQPTIADESFRAKRKLFVLLCGGTNFPDTFSYTEKIIQNYCLMLEAKYAGGAFFPAIDAKGDILKEPKFADKIKKEINNFLQM